MAKKKTKSIISLSLVLEALKKSFIKLNPLHQIKTPVIFVTYTCAIVTTLCVLIQYYRGDNISFNLQISTWIWLTVLFSNFSESIAESQGKAQVSSLHKSQLDLYARKLHQGIETRVHAADLNKGDLVLCQSGDIIPGDGEIVEGIATVDESAVTGESAPVIRESGGDRSAVTIGTRVVSDSIIVRITQDPGCNFLDRMIALIEGAERQKTPNELSLNIILSGQTLSFLIVICTIPLFMQYYVNTMNQSLSQILSVPILAGLLVCLIPTTIGGLISAIGIAGMERLIQRNVIAKSGKAIEAAGDIDVLIMDKTGTITLGNRMATDFIPIGNVAEKELAESAQLASLSDETPEGRSIVVLAKEKFNLRGETISGNTQNSKFFPFSAQTRSSGVDIFDEQGNKIQTIRKGAVDAIFKLLKNNNKDLREELEQKIKNIAAIGATPLLVIKNDMIMGIVVLKDVVKGGIKERFDHMRRMGIRTIMVTGDNPLTAAAIAAEAGVDDFIAQATPEQKMDRIKEEQLKGRLVAMTGDGTNDAPALAQADVGVALNTGTQASREAGNMIDLDSNPTKIIEIVEIGKQLLMTRGSLTTFSIANDIAKYLAILPAVFGSLYIADGHVYGPLRALDIMDLNSPKSAILSSVIFNALVITYLIPLALKGIKYEAQKAYNLLKNNLLVYGLGGFLTPFVGIKIIDLIVTYLGLV